MTVPVSNMTAQFANTDYRYDAIGMDANTNGYAANSTLIHLKANSESRFWVDVDGNILANGSISANGNVIVDVITANSVNVLGTIIIGDPDSDLTLANSAFVDNTIVADIARANTTNSTSIGVTNLYVNDLYVNGQDIMGQQTIWVPAASMVSRNETAEANTWATGGGNSYKTMDFSGSTNQYAQFSIQMPKGWDESTDLVAQFVWSNPTSSSSGVVWGLAAQGLADGNSLNTSVPSLTYATDTCTTAQYVRITSEITLTPGGSPGAEELLTFVVMRYATHGSDTYGGLGQLHGVKIHYQTASVTDN